MKKFVLIVSVMMLASVSVVAGEYGVIVKGAIMSNKTSLEKAQGAVGNTDVKKGKTNVNGIAGLELFYEEELNETGSIGVSIGAGILSQDKYSWQTAASSGDIKFNSYLAPLTVYYKEKVAEGFNVYGGVGAAFLLTDTNLKTTKVGSPAVNDKAKAHKIFPFLNVGAEWRASSLIGVGLEAKYSFKGKIDKFGGAINNNFREATGKNIIFDVSEVSGGLFLKFYI